MATGNMVGLAFAALALGALPAAAAPPAAAPAAPAAQAAPALLAMEQAEGDVDLHDFAFPGGERLPLLHHTALGTPRRGATGNTFPAPNFADHLFRPGQPLNVQRHYVVFPDGVGFGGSPGLDRIKAPMLAVNLAHDQVNPAQLAVACDTTSHLPSARFALLPGGWGHAAIFHAEAWASQLGPFLAGLSGQEASR